MTVSVITPIFKGERFIQSLKKNLIDCAQNVNDGIKVEWVVSNDDPEKNVYPSDESGLIDVVVLRTDRNRGIQGARVRGLNNASGDYILFLDQDDWISPNWIQSQVEHIGNADAVVCNALRDGRQFYNTAERPSLDVCIKKEYNLNQKWGFIPGQVLLRKTAIPRLWREKWLSWNCCDDYYLWLCMYSEGCKFVKNEDVLYNHITNGTNQSLNSYEWYKSTMEMIEIVKEFRLFEQPEIDSFMHARFSDLEETLIDKAWQVKKLGIYKDLLMLREKNINLSYALKDLKSVHIAIYGLTIGEHVYLKLAEEGVEIDCFIDRNAEGKVLPVPIYPVEMTPETIDTVINTLIKDRASVDKYLLSRNKSINIISLRELINCALDESERGIT